MTPPGNSGLPGQDYATQLALDRTRDEEEEEDEEEGQCQFFESVVLCLVGGSWAGRVDPVALWA